MFRRGERATLGDNESVLVTFKGELPSATPSFGKAVDEGDGRPGVDLVEGSS